MVKPVAVVVAMQSELVHLVPDGISSVELSSGIWTETHTAIGEIPVIAIRCGIGMVAAAAATEHLIARYDPRGVLNFGCTGSHVREQFPGDVVIGSGSVAHAPVRIDAEGVEIFSLGGFGVGEDAESAHYFASDPELLNLAEAAADSWNPAAWPVGSAPRPPRVVTGNVGSGDVWNQHIVRLERLNKLHGTLCEDMEAAAIAQISALHGVPFLTIKDISNNEFLEVTDFDAHGAGILESELGRRAGELTWRTLTLLAGQSL
jgi:adenosylhomocysteine nucleosidase